MKPLELGISSCANANPGCNSGFMLDHHARNILFGPYFQRFTNKLEGALVFGHGEANALSNGQLHVVASLRDLHDVYGSRRDEWGSGYLPYALLHGGCPPVSIFMVEPGVDLFVAVREFIVDGHEYEYQTALKWAMDLIGEDAKYTPNQDEQMRLAELNGPEQERLRQFAQSTDPWCTPPSPVGIINSGKLRVNKAPNYSDLGRSPNARKRWPK